MQSLVIEELTEVSPPTSSDKSKCSGANRDLLSCSRTWSGISGEQCWQKLIQYYLLSVLGSAGTSLFNVSRCQCWAEQAQGNTILLSDNTLREYGIIMLRRSFQCTSGYIFDLFKVYTFRISYNSRIKLAASVCLIVIADKQQTGNLISMKAFTSVWYFAQLNKVIVESFRSSLYYQWWNLLCNN